MATQGERRAHIVLNGIGRVERYTARAGGGARAVVPPQDRAVHAAALRTQLAAVEAVQRELSTLQREDPAAPRIGLQVEFASFADVPLAVESLARDRQGIELMNVRQHDGRVFATVFVPDGKLSHFKKVLGDYESRQVRDNQRLVDAIQSVHVAEFDAVWNDTADALPPDDVTPIWWEAWLPIGAQRDATVASFRQLAERAGLSVRDAALQFPERSVVLMHGSRQQILDSALLLCYVAELRRAKNTAEFFDRLPPDEQADWGANMQARLQRQPPDPTEGAYVTLLDTGVNRGHPLLAPLIDASDLHVVNPEWDVDDRNGHGTQLAGLALLGDLKPLLEGEGPVAVAHGLESVKLLRWPSDNEGESHGLLTAQAVARAEIAHPHRRRIFGMAVTASDGRDRGRPSSWSAELDRLAYGADDSGVSSRLLVISAGNMRDEATLARYPESLRSNGAQDPAQAWNVLTVGAYTQLSDITEPHCDAYRAIAPVDALSPYTTTSATWAPDWPFKPDIVLEGGNAAIDPGGFVSNMHSLSLLTPHHRPNERLFDTCWATSAATALATRMAAQIRSHYPDLWPETVRGLMVHAARWTPQMLNACLPRGPAGRTGRHLQFLLRTCGYGVPSLERALWSASNSLTLIVQDELQPYLRDGSDIKTCDMHFHALPWPEDLLLDLGETEVKLRVTLSYFIEPNPGERGMANKYSYQSHALRFAVRRPAESQAQFARRINDHVEDGEQTVRGQAVGADRNWFIGESLRRRGSLLSDVWTGRAADLANLGQLAVFPAMGWWRGRLSAARYERKVRYALLVSIEAPEVEVDLYAAVAAQVRAVAEVVVPT